MSDMFSLRSLISEVWQLAIRDVGKYDQQYYVPYTAGVEPGPLLLRLFIGLLCQPWMTDGDDCGTIGGMSEWHGETEIFEGNLPQCHSVHQRSHMT
jgi:hypothetical protein